jgi:DNA-directed RNA polymerase specialized sigma24 family protein
VRVHDGPVVAPRDAVERVWRDDGPRLWRSLIAFAGDQELASDAMAEAFAQALGHRGEIEAPDRSIGMPEPVTDLVRALQTLTPNQRASAVLALYADLPTREVARILACSQATVRVHLSQAKRRLRALLEETYE